MVRHPFPAYNLFRKEWILNLDGNLQSESGSVEMIAGDYIHQSLYYPLEKKKPDGAEDHCHSFDEVIEYVIFHPEEFSIDDDSEYYSLQQIRFLKKLREKMLDVRKRESGFYDLAIKEGHDSGDCYWIMPVKISDCETIHDEDVTGLEEISIAGNTFYHLLLPLFEQYYDCDSDLNRKRYLSEGNHSHFEFYLEHNFYTYEQIEDLLSELDEMNPSETETILRTK